MNPPAQLPSVDAHAGYWIRLVSNQVSHRLGLKLQPHGVTMAEWVVLRELADGDARPGDLAARLGLTRSALSRLADRLLAKSLITRHAVAGDLRAQRLALSARSRALIPPLAALAAENDDAFFGHLGPEHRETIRMLMKNIIHRARLAKSTMP